MTTLRYGLHIPISQKNNLHSTKKVSNGRVEMVFVVGVFKAIAKVMGTLESSCLRKEGSIKYFLKFCKNRKIVRFIIFLFYLVN